MWFWLACTPPSPVVIPSSPAPDGPTLPTPTDTASPGGTGGSGGTGGTGGTGTATTQVGFPWIDFDCTVPVPVGPFQHRRLDGTSSNEDITLDMDGFLLAADWSGNLLRYTHEGDSSVWATDFGDPTGLEILPDGDLAVADRSQSRVVTRDHDTGAVVVVAASINWPNGIEVAPDGSIFVTESYEEVVYRVDPATMEIDVVAEDIPSPDGISFDPTYHTLYVAGLERPDIVAIPVNGPGDYGEPYPLELPEDVPWTWVDGIQVDRCGNLYIADFMGDVWRLDPDTGVIDNVLSDPAATLPALRFGTGVGGWDPLKIYVSTYSEVIEVDVGVPNKPRWPADWP